MINEFVDLILRENSVKQAEWVELGFESIIYIRSAQGSDGAYQGIYFTEDGEEKYESADFYWVNGLDRPVFMKRTKVSGLLSSYSEIYILFLPLNSITTK